MQNNSIRKQLVSGLASHITPNFQQWKFKNTFTQLNHAWVNRDKKKWPSHDHSKREMEIEREREKNLMKNVTKSNYCPRFSAKFERAQQKPRMFFFKYFFNWYISAKWNETRSRIQFWSILTNDGWIEIHRDKNFE